MTEQDQEYTRICFAMMITNGLLTRLNLNEINPKEVWNFADLMMDAKDVPRIGLPLIKTKRGGAK